MIASADTSTAEQKAVEAKVSNAKASAHLWALLGYFALAIIVTYPAIIHFTSAIPGDLIADRDQNLWNLWWVREAISRFTNPFHTGMLYYPYGVSLYYHTLGLPQGLIGLAPQLLFGLPAAYNTVLLAAFTLSGYGAFRLGLMYTGKPLPSFLGGIIFAFTPYTLDALKGQLEVLSLQWIPFYVESWLRASTSAPLKHRIIPLLSASIFLSLAALSSLYYALYLLLFTGAYLIYSLVTIQNPGTLRVTKIQNTAVVALLSLTIISPFIAGLAASRNDPRFEITADPAHRLAHSADLMSFFTPPHDHPLLAKSIERPGVEEPPIHDYLSLGYIALALAILGAIVRRKEKDVTFWAILGIASLILAMGPQLQINRNLTGIPLPFKLIEDLPGIDAIAKPERLVVLARLCMSILAAWGAAWVVGRFQVQGSRLKILYLMLLVLLLIELPIHPRYEQPLAIPQAARELARQSGSDGLMELPFATQQAQVVGERMLSQTVHERPIMAGYLSRNYSSPIIDSCSPFWRFISPRDVPTEGQEIASPLVTEHPLDVLNFYNIGYIALYNRYASPDSPLLDPEDRTAYQAILSAVSTSPSLYQDDDAGLFRVDQEDLSKTGPSFHIGGGWYKPEVTGGVPFRWMNGGESTVCVFAPRETEAALVMESTSFGQSRHAGVTIEGNSILVSVVPAGGQFAALKTPSMNWKEGVTEVRIVSPEPGTSPRSADPNVKDDRLLTLGFRGVRLERTSLK